MPQPPPPVAAAPDGQWVYTQQYGWIWMTYADDYVWVPPSGTGEPLEYVYYPSYGWAWVAAPWIWGVGPWPYFGRRPPTTFAWYRHGWWRSPERWRYVPAPERGTLANRGVRPAPQRQGRALPQRTPPERREGADRARSGQQREPRRDGERQGERRAE